MSTSRQGGFRRLREVPNTSIGNGNGAILPPDSDAANKYREERPLADLHPDLNVYDELPFVSATSATHAVCSPPSHDLEVAVAKLTKVPRFRIVPTGNASFDDADPYLREIGYADQQGQDQGQAPTSDAFARFLSLEEDLIDPYSNDSSGPFPKFNDFVRVEYDMDQVDLQHLTAVNKKRASHKPRKLSPVSREAFEATMTLLEISWYELERRMPPRSKLKLTDEIPDSEDQKCVICDDGECDNNNAIVFCDGCDIGVHQDCYGVPFIPEGQWLCRACEVSRRKLFSCAFCPNKSGAFKKTDTGEWAHLVCSLWIPETTILDSIFLEPVSGLDNIDRNRWKLTCYICKKRVGACIQCSNKKCLQAYHATCGRKARLHMKLQNGIQGALLDQSTAVSYCEKHTPESHNPKISVASTVAAAKEYYQNQVTVISEDEDDAPGPVYPWKTKKGSPVIPEYIAQRVAVALSKFNIEETQQWVYDTCQYWALKRESKKNAFLLKRLQNAPAPTNLDLDFAGAQERLDTLESSKQVLANLRSHVDTMRHVESLKYSAAAKNEIMLVSTFFNHMRSIERIWTSFCKTDEGFEAATTGTRKLLSQSSAAASVIKKIKTYKYKSIADFKTDLEYLITIGSSSEYPYFARRAGKVRVIIDKMLHKAAELERHALQAIWDELKLPLNGRGKNAEVAAPPPEALEEEGKAIEIHAAARKRKRFVDDI